MEFTGIDNSLVVDEDYFFVYVYESRFEHVNGSIYWVHIMNHGYIHLNTCARY